MRRQLLSRSFSDCTDPDPKCYQPAESAAGETDNLAVAPRMRVNIEKADIEVGERSMGTKIKYAVAGIVLVILGFIGGYWTGLKQANRFQLVNGTGGQLAFDPRTGQRCWTAQPVYNKDANPIDHFLAQLDARKDIPLCIEIK